MTRGARLAFWVLVCFALAAQGCSGCSKPPPIPLEVPETTGPLVFPPPDDGWSDRLPMRGTSSSREIRAYSPKLAADGTFEAGSNEFELAFDDALFAEADLKAAPTLTLTPPVNGRTTWTSNRSVVFRADQPFALDVEYTVSLPELTGPSGKKLVGGYKARFKGRAEITIGGKIIHYQPKPGAPRPIYVRPIDDRDIGPSEEMLVFYDGPIDLAAAGKLVTLVDGKTQAKIPLSIKHPPPGDTFEGERIDARQILLVKAARPIAPDAKVVLAAASSEGVTEPITRDLHVPPPARVLSVECNSAYGSSCEVKGTTLRGPATSGISIKLSNRIHGDDVEGKVTVTPLPENLRVGGYGDEVYVDASWAPATTYQIRMSGLRDRFGYAVPEVSATFIALPRAAHAVLREGVMVLDETAARDMFVTTRNVKKGELLVWTVPPGSASLLEALKLSRANEVPTAFGAPLVLPFDGAGQPHAYGKANLDLWGKLEAGHSYLAQARVKQPANGAKPVAYDQDSGARPSVPLFVLAGKETVGAHTHLTGGKAVVSVFRLANGEPVAGAGVTMGTAQATTDDRGVAVLDEPAKRGDAEAVTIKVGAEETVVPLDKISTQARELYPALAAGETAGDEEGSFDAAPARITTDLLGVLVTDRGIYKPGTKMFVKGHVRRGAGQRLGAVAGTKVRLRITDVTGSDLLDEAMVTGPKGTITKEVTIPAGQQTGPAHIKLEVDDDKHATLADQTVRIADFETPRFKVDIEAPPDMPAGRWKSTVIGRYAFGAPMEEGRVEWTLAKKLKAIESRALEASGFAFTMERSEFAGADPLVEERPRAGEGKLAPDGTFAVDVELGPLPNGPTEVTFEADVTDASYRHIANRTSVIRYPFARYAGLRLPNRFGAVGPLKVELVAVDKDGKPVTGASVEARLERLEWKKSSQKAESGAMVETWGMVATQVGTCSVASDATPHACDLVTKARGEYRVVARIDGHDQASTSFYAWSSDASEPDPTAVPSAGKKTPISSDKKSYAPGETAKILVQSPFPEAMAVLTVERGGLLAHEARRFKGPSVVLEVPVSLAHAPYAHAVVTLLPINGGPEATYRIGAMRIPVTLDGSRLTVQVTSSKPRYDAKDSAEITVQVMRGNEPVENADVTLAVVDDGVLRLTNFHAIDPTGALHPPRPLSFTAADSRALLFRRREQAHVAGGGSGEGADSFDTRRDFVETAAWLPTLTTGRGGKVKTTVKLPDNLTELRMMATVLAEDGAAGAAESSFLVTRPYLVDPIVPAFASQGDTLEIAAMAHNNTEAPVNARVTILGQKRDVRLAAMSHARVSVPWKAVKSTLVDFLLEVDGKTKDKVERSVTVALPGTEEHPQLSGVFRERQEITLAIPADAIFEENAKLTLHTGAALYPELGQRLAYLREYPHGCVEQTTSGTLPYLAAKNLLAWTGALALDDAELKKRIDSGIKRLATMKTAGGGLAFWPGGTEPHVYGTTYAARALLAAKEIGIEEEGLLPGVLAYLAEELPRQRDPVVRVAIAEILAAAGKLDASIADSLWDAREKLDAYGKASLALTLATFPAEQARAREALDAVEAAFDDAGMVKQEVHGEGDHWYWGSTDRDRAQAMLALVKLRPQSKLVTVLAHRLLRGLDRYSTQSSAWSLMALSSFVGKDKPNGAVDVKVKAEGLVFDRTRRLGGDNKEVVIALQELRGKKVKLVLEGDAKAPSAFSMEARFVRPDGASARSGRRARLGPSVYRVFSDARGAPVDLAHVKAGEVVRVALRIELPPLDAWRASYLAVTDRFGAGFQPIQPDLATVASPPSLGQEHPFYQGLTGWGGSASHVDVRDDRVNVYFDQVYGGTTAYATYLLRAVTPGEFVVPAARGELMYEPGSEGYSETGHVTIQ
ncbi:MAG: hypothetical protein JWP97_6731 [Labilithrix sp.]|nr:hypothetical protein [Labilithrix sp.]